MCSTATRTAITSAALAFLALSIWHPRIDLLSILSAAASIGGAAALWCVHYWVQAQKTARRAAAAERTVVELKRTVELLDGDEDRALWDSVPAAGSLEEDTCVFGKEVIALNQWRLRYPKAG